MLWHISWCREYGNRSAYPNTGNVCICRNLSVSEVGDIAVLSKVIVTNNCLIIMRLRTPRSTHRSPCLLPTPANWAEARKRDLNYTLEADNNPGGCLMEETSLKSLPGRADVRYIRTSEPCGPQWLFPNIPNLSLDQERGTDARS